jgi:hypothetical protein
MVIEIKAAGLAPPTIPTKYQPPLLVYANGMVTVERALQLLEMIARRHPQVLVGGGVVDHLQAAKQSAFKICWDMARMDIVYEEGTQPLIPEASNHRLPLTDMS